MSLLLIAAFFPAVAQDTPKEVKAKALAALAMGAFEDAIPPLQQLVEWFGSSTKEGTIAEMEEIYYSLGLSHLFLAQFGPCREAYQVYLKKYARYARAPLVAIFVADTLRYESKLAEALKAYKSALDTYDYSSDLRTDILCSVARCYLAEEKWADAVPVLNEVFRTAPDHNRRNWAGAMLTVSYLKDMKVDPVYDMMPLLLTPESFAARSVALNMSALEAGDDLFAEEKYRDALWIYRMVYPHDTLAMNCQMQLERQQRRVERYRRIPNRPRELLRAQEQVAEIEGELKALEEIPVYDPELFFRIARSYLEVRRYREASDLFHFLYSEGLTEKKEDCLYLSFFAASKVRPMDLAIQRGLEYMKDYPSGQYYDTVSLTVGELYANVQNWYKVIEILGGALEARPKHEQIVEVLYLLGYAEFMLERFPDAAAHMKRINADFPGNDRAPDAAYWAGMALLFDKRYEEARPFFDRVTSEFPECPFAEDAAFRSPTCDFGLSQYYDAEKKLLVFIQRYPQSKLIGEAYLMLGDISGTVGELQEAVRRYREAMTRELNVELYNHAAFRTGEILKELKDFAGVIEHFNAYLQRDVPESNRPLAIFWIGDAQWELGRPAEALQLFLEALRKYGGDRKELGVDLILEKFVDRTRAADKALTRQAWADLREILKKALTERQYTLALRAERILLFDPGTSDVEKQAMLKFMLRPENLRFASPGVMELMIDEAARAGHRELSLQTARAIVFEFPETDYALAARKALADDAMARKDWDEALLHLNIIREVYATSPEAADALLALGRLYMAKEQYDLADAAYRDLLGVKEWKDLWPEALFGRGDIAIGKRQYDVAAAYYERIYLLYGAHKDWSARAYVARARCLARLNQHRKAIETLSEMLKNEDLAKTAEAEEARKLLETYQKQVI